MPGQSVFAANGINLIGFGIESNFLVGADVAAARDTSALNTNPAGLTQIESQQLDTHFAAGYASGMRHEDQFGNDRASNNKLIPILDFGYARKLFGSRLTFGFGMFAQGGAGYVYKDLNTAFGTRDELSSLFRIGKLIPGIAYQASDRLSLGLALPIVIADLQQKIFPDTSVANSVNPAQSFFGSKLTGARGTAVGLRLGAQYRIYDAFTLGITYSSKTKLTLKGGKLSLNMTAAGLGQVDYGDARAEGLALPQEVGLGLAWRPTSPWLISFKLAWLNWASAMKTSTLTATNPDNPAAPPTVENKSTLNWCDQTAFAVGAAYQLNDRTTLMGGYNYGKNPIPNETTNPLLAAFAEHHLTLGALRKFGQHWQLAAGIEYDFKKSVTYNNPNLPFGPGARETGELFAVHLGLSRRW